MQLSKLVLCDSFYFFLVRHNNKLIVMREEDPYQAPGSVSDHIQYSDYLRHYKSAYFLSISKI